MRKVIYGCAALVVAGAFAAYLAADHAARHPESLVGRCTVTAAQLGARINPFAMLGQAVARQRSGPVACETNPAQRRPLNPLAARMPRPEAEDEMPQDEAAEGVADEAPEVIRVEGGNDEAGALPPIDQGQDDGCEPDQDDAAPEGDQTDEPVRFGTVEGAEPVRADDAAPSAKVRMPYADEEDNDPSEAESENPCGWLWDLFRNLLPCGSDEAGADAATSGAPAPASAPETSCPDCHHDHCPAAGCPHDECPFSHGPAQKPVKSKKRHSDKPADDQGKLCPANPSGLDTLEYRPSDGNAHAFEGLWF
jgi:hypothetical protein